LENENDAIEKHDDRDHDELDSGRHKPREKLGDKANRSDLRGSIPV